MTLVTTNNKPLLKLELSPNTKSVIINADIVKFVQSVKKLALKKEIQIIVLGNQS